MRCCFFHVRHLRVKFTLLIEFYFRQSINGLNKPIEIDWLRVPGQTCNFPNVSFDFSPIDEFGGFCCRFSPSGNYLAWTTAGQVEHSLIIQSSISKLDGSPAVTTVAHAGIIYDLDWSSDSSRIALCSADKTATIWNIPRYGFNILTVLLFWGRILNLRHYFVTCNNIDLSRYH